LRPAFDPLPPVRRLRGLGFESSGGASIDWDSIDDWWDDPRTNDLDIGLPWGNTADSSTRAKSILPLVVLAGVGLAVLVHNSGGKKRRR
jgi:hypothetical protein